jgi:hypothetical protein
MERQRNKLIEDYVKVTTWFRVTKPVTKPTKIKAICETMTLRLIQQIKLALRGGK